MAKRKTHEEFTKEVFNLVKNEYEILGKYINNSSKIIFKHNKCKKEFMMSPNSFLSNHRCFHCFGEIKKTTESFKSEVFNLVHNEYEILSDYKNNKTKVLFKHIFCNNEFLMSPNCFLSGSRCPKCAINHLKTTEEFKKEVFTLIDLEYEVLGKYKNAKTKILFKHTICNAEFLITPDDFLQGKGCPECAGNKRKTTEYFKHEVYNLVGNEYEVLGKYKNNKTKINMKHNICSTKFKVSPSDFLQGQRCPSCQKKIFRLKRQTPFEEVKQYIESFDGYVLLSITYEVAREKLQIKCPLRHIYKASLNSFKNGNRCPKCNESKGEKRISNLLNIHNVIHSPQYKFKDCKDKRPLPFDQAIFDDYGNLYCLIEYDGLFHFEPARFSKNKNKNIKKFKKVQLHDSIKNTYCEENNIKLVRIPYWDKDNIEKILTKELSDLIGGDY